MEMERLLTAVLSHRAAAGLHGIECERANERMPRGREKKEAIHCTWLRMYPTPAEHTRGEKHHSRVAPHGKRARPHHTNHTG